jgi:membrane-anchored protein YejM (alkaline phosphatase superfamily)
MVDHLKLNKRFDPTPVRNRFQNAARFVDAVAAPVLERLERESLLEHTVVVVTGDHGQEFNETGQNYWGHNGNFSRYQTEVPFIVWWPGKGPARLTHPTSHLDLAPTVLKELLNCTTAPEKFGNGKSLFDPSSRAPLLLATWDRFALASPGRIDVLFETGQADHYDENYHEIATPMPPKLISTAMEGMSRFYAR